MLLLSLEIVVNEVALNLEPGASVISELNTSVWEESRAKLAGLLPTEDFEAIGYYYSVLGVLKDSWPPEGITSIPEKDREAASVVLSDASAQGAQLVTLAHSYVRDAKFINRFREASKQIKEAGEAKPS